MRFMMLVKSAENSAPPPKALMDAIAQLAADTSKAGTMIETGGLAPSTMTTRVRLSEGKISSLDGPFAETREVVGGYAIFEFNSKQEAVESAREFMELHRIHWPGWEGETEIRQIFTMPDYTCASGTLELKEQSASGS